MPIVRLLQQSSFDPDAIEVIAGAFDIACSALGLSDRTDPLTEIIAKRIIEAAQSGERDPLKLSRLAIDSLSATTPGYPGWPTTGDDSKQAH
jgi:hypothetical protein